MARIDWPGLLAVGLGRPETGGLGLSPEAFWRLTPLELRHMLGQATTATPINRARLSSLMAAFPDQRKGEASG